ncbi:MAG: ABC transporter ATP-binding protein [Bdellovibrionota bacterium]
MSHLIEFQSVTKIYKSGFWGKRQTALDRLTLSVPAQSIYGFLGANGAGKTTGIKILMSLQFATSGQVKVFGLDPTSSEAKARIGYLPERPYFHDTMKAHEFLRFHRDLFGNGLKGRKLPSSEELLELVGIPNVADKPLKDFSKGMLQRIGIAQALVNDPELVILDEPMSGLDPVGRREVRDLILRLAQQGKTIFFSSHILSDVETLCHRIAFLEKGVLKFEGSLQEVRNTGSGGVEVLFRGLSAEALKQSKLLSASVPTGEAQLLLCRDPAEARNSIEEIWRSGGLLISSQPQQSTLEDFLFGKEGKR